MEIAAIVWWRVLHNTELMADPTRFERATFAFGGQTLAFGAVCVGLHMNGLVRQLVVKGFDIS
jgi:hypothetical protein